MLAPDFVYTNANGAVMGKRAYLRAYVLNPSVVWRSQKLRNVRVRVSGDTAVLTAGVHDVARFGDHDLDANHRTTQVYVRRKGCWQYLAGHTSNPGGNPQENASVGTARHRA